MAQSTLVDGARNLANRFEELVNKVPTPKSKENKKTDTSWHDKEVQEANASFAKKANGKRKVGGTEKDRTVAKNNASKRKASTKRTGY